MKELIGKLWEFLKENKLWVEGIEQFQDLPVIDIEISWGDWKHDHLRLDYLIQNGGFGLKKMTSWTTEEDGSDCYSGVHRFMLFN